MFYQDLKLTIQPLLHVSVGSNYRIDMNLKAILKVDSRQTCREVTQKINSNAITMSHHFQSTGSTQDIENIKEHRLQAAAQHL